MTALKNLDSITLDRYVAPIGVVFINLLSLEFLLRLFLYETQDKPYKAFKPGQDLTGLRLGAVLPENSLTNYDQLEKLIRRYNSKVVKLNWHECQIDQNLVELRNALAHGRLFIRKNGLRLGLIKFTPPKIGKVKVNFAATFTQKWLTTQSKRLQIASAKVQRARHAFDTRRAA